MNLESYWRAGARRKRKRPRPKRPFSAPRQRKTGAYNALQITQTPRWRNWQTHYFEVVAPQGVQVQILSWALESRPATGRLLCSNISRLDSSRVTYWLHSQIGTAARGDASECHLGRTERNHDEQSSL